MLWTFYVRALQVSVLFLLVIVLFLFQRKPEKSLCMLATQVREKCRYIFCGIKVSVLTLSLPKSEN